MEKIDEWNENVNITWWKENVNITWWKESRTKLNKIIRKYNKWVEFHSDNKIKTAKLLAKINKHLEMSYCNTDGGSGYKEELEKIKAIVFSKLS
jgi:hypothetical protein